MYPMKLKPIYDKNIWANHRLANMRNIKNEGYGTSWEISAHPHACNVIINGEYKNRTLDEIIKQYPKEMLGDIPFSSMLRLAYLDAKEDLSIQVHPYDEYAHIHEQDEGKCESWYILEADEGATLVAGTNTTDINEIRECLDKEILAEHLLTLPVQKGDFVCIPAGMLHALGKGIFALEIGQNSNTTYRFYDYNRKDAQGHTRELHLEKSFDVVDFSLHTKIQHYPIKEELTQNKTYEVLRRKEFCVDLVDIMNSYDIICDKNRFLCLSNVGKKVTMHCHNMDIEVAFGEHVFVPACCPDIHVNGSTRLLISYVDIT